MSWSLPDIVEEARRRFALQLASSFAAPAGSRGSNDSIALRASDAQVGLAREAQTRTRGAKQRHNRGMLARVATLTIESDGTLFLPDDVVSPLAVSDNLADDLFDLFSRGARKGQVQLVGKGHCGGDFSRAHPDRWVFPASKAGSQLQVLYNSNLNGVWTAGKVSSATATAMTPDAAPTYPSLPLSTTPDIYNNLYLWTKRAGDGAVQKIRILDYDGTFTIYGTAWPSYTPAGGDAWSTMSALPYRELMLLELGSLIPEASNYKAFAPRHAGLRSQFVWDVQAGHMWASA